MAKEEQPQLKVGVIFPVSFKSKRTINRELDSLANWSRTYIKQEELLAHQLPLNVVKPNGRGNYKKPNYW